MNKKAARLIGADIPMHQKLGRYENFDPRPDLPFADQLPVMSFGEKIVISVAVVAVFWVLIFSDAPW